MTNSNEEARLLPDWKKVLVSRQEFLKALGLAAGGIITLVISIPSVAFMLNFLFVREARRWVTVGPVNKFQPGETTNVEFEDPYALPWDGVTGRRTAWLRRNVDDTFLAFAINCTHLGCPVRWEASAELFMCPCHGGVYYSNGDVAGGPPPMPLHRYNVRVNQDQVEVNVGPVLQEG